MRTSTIFLALVVIVAGLAGNAGAGSRIYGFESGYWGFNGDAGYTTWFSLENSEGQPAPCLHIKGMSGFGLEVTRPELVGDFAGAGYGRIGLDLKILSWFPPSSPPSPVPRIFLQRSNGHSPWAKVVDGFSPVKGQWQRIYVDFNPAWTDAQARAAGWQIEPFGLPNATFKDTCRSVFASGVWLKFPGPLTESYFLIDNYSLLAPGSSRPQLKPFGKRVILPKSRPLQK
jgi:hypothetical protein